MLPVCFRVQRGPLDAAITLRAGHESQDKSIDSSRWHACSAHLSHCIGPPALFSAQRLCARSAAYCTYRMCRRGFKLLLDLFQPLLDVFACPRRVATWQHTQSTQACKKQPLWVSTLRWKDVHESIQLFMDPQEFSAAKVHKGWRKGNIRSKNLTM